ncbi:hypothetical protein GIB67_022867 [Kingdonia uniflora]|uniref:Alpha-1,3-mannosyl-glycoprotein 2-beta-N-acetylglucosaminyltransferase n=1 Tax=Kingdonia uniflora TaxID=39325 RepID=A0A7J7P6X4_9MAGN|nr:hypothetical protein GIB67_022867 [Kingdonia uniflora]
MDEQDGDAIDMAFSKKKIEARKNWLGKFNSKTHLDQKEKLIKYSDFVNKELILFSMADLQRSIPSMVDGLKPERRKILFCSFKQNFTNEAKVAQFFGYVSGHSAYHHGEQNLAGTIIGMAQDFVGSNNINLLQPNEASEGGFDPKETMARNVCEVQILLFAVAAAFIYIQMRLFGTQSGYADHLVAAVESESYCTSEVWLLIDQISTQHKRIVSLEEKKKSQDQECGQLRALVHDLERNGAQNVVDKLQVRVAAIVVMACNCSDYLERTIESILKYQRSVALKFPLFVSRDGPNENVKHKALSYNQITYMQHLDFGIVQTERLGELIAYYKIASYYKWALDGLFYKHNFTRVIILEDDMEISPDFFRLL